MHLLTLIIIKKHIKNYLSMYLITDSNNKKDNNANKKVPSTNNAN